MPQTVKIITGDALAILATLPDHSAHCCVTSPPYWCLRDYGVAGQMGLEPTPQEYVAGMVAVFREARRVLRDDGTLWLNLGDSYAREGGTTPGLGRHWDGRADQPDGMHDKKPIASAIGLKQKDLCGIPWRVAFALQADGWYLRSDIIWSKPNPMPESVTDRPTKAHEYVFLLSKSARYYYDTKATAEPFSDDRQGFSGASAEIVSAYSNDAGRCGDSSLAVRRNGARTRNKRSVWTIPTEPYAGAHFAVMPTALVKPCVLAGCAPGGVVLDPFAGSGTVGVVAMREGLSFVGIELNPSYADMARRRVANETPASLFGDQVAAGP